MCGAQHWQDLEGALESCPGTMALADARKRYPSTKPHERIVLKVKHGD